MGRIKTRVVKRFTEDLFSKNKDKFSDDYYKNKALIKDFASINSQKLNNVVAGYLTKLVKLSKKEE